MMRWKHIVAGTTAGVAASAVLAASIGGRRWDRGTARLVDRIVDSSRVSRGSGAQTYSPEQLAGLPAPVVRYFGFALMPGQRLISNARVEHAGEFAARPGQWSPFTSVQHFTVRPPGFVWSASIRATSRVPGLSIRVRDGYVDGEGMMRGALGAILPVVDVHGTPEMAAGALARYLAESVWFPTALLPGAAGAGVVWTALDDSTARATLSDRGNTVSVDFHFGARGEIVRVTGERYRDVNGTGVLTPWEGRFRDYARVNDVMVPMSGEVEWLPAEGALPYWRARVTSVGYDPW
ncbi:MAG TPA: DUF6544 family protein [Gemmatimonadaceae bacterium]|nr:DUF6544 family protein [Gemmatimonadaceae bacterium]